MLDKLSRVYIPLFLVAAALLVASCNSVTNTNTNTANQNSSPAAASQSPPASSNATPGAKLNINTASSADFLRAIPNLGNRMVHEFEEYRPYNSILQFRKEIGKYVDQNKVAEYEKYIFVPIDENQSDAATLQQIPGLDANEAQELIAGRPYASREAFLAKLAEKISAPDLATARNYLIQR